MNDSRPSGTNLALIPIGALVLFSGDDGLVRLGIFDRINWEDGEHGSIEVWRGDVRYKLSACDPSAPEGTGTQVAILHPQNNPAILGKRLYDTWGSINQAYYELKGTKL